MLINFQLLHYEELLKWLTFCYYIGRSHVIIYARWGFQGYIAKVTASLISSVAEGRTVMSSCCISLVFIAGKL
jgi:hypothetical protein